jgi:hypothetical protein
MLEALRRSFSCNRCLWIELCRERWNSGCAQASRALLDLTAEGGCPYVIMAVRAMAVRNS